jgi:uncharacterized protein
LEVEAIIAARRRGPVALDLARRLMRAVEVIEMEPDIRRAAGELTGLRSLDAIHLATALSLGDRCGAFFAYDDRLAAAARGHGLTVSVPRA